MQVRGSPKASKISFLQQKGLTEPEIDEAFRRVPETTTPAVARSPSPPSSSLVATANHIIAPPPSTISSQQPSQQPRYPHYAVIPQQQQQQHEPVRWSQVVLGAGFAAASAYAVKSLVWPFIYDKCASWRGVGSIDDGRSAKEEAASSDVAAVADAIRAQTAEMASSIQALKELVSGLDQQRPESPEDHLTAAELRQELRGIAHSLNEIAGMQQAGGSALLLGPSKKQATTTTTTTAAATTDRGGGPSVDDNKNNSGSSLEGELSEIKALLVEYLKTPRSVAGDDDTFITPREPGAETEVEVEAVNTNATHQPKQRGTPASYRSASDNQQRSMHSSGAPSPTQLGRRISSAGSQYNTTTTGATTVNQEPRNVPASYMEVLEMLERGETPPGIRDDIDDSPPDPTHPPPPSRMKPLPKPWEQRVENSNGEGQGEGEGEALGVLSPVMPSSSLDKEREEGRTSPSSTTSGGGGGSAAKVASSIYEAAVSSRGSPGMIAGKLVSPPPPPPSQRRGVATPTALFPRVTSPTAPPTHPISALTDTTHTPPLTGAGGEEVSSGSGGGSGNANANANGNGQGSGLGRPGSKTWRPPPIPMPTLTSYAVNDGLTPTPTPTLGGAYTNTAYTNNNYNSTGEGEREIEREKERQGNGGSDGGPSRPFSAAPSQASLGANFFTE